MSGQLLECHELTKSFGGVLANDKIDFSVGTAEIRGIIGPNGSGKSTFFNTLTGFYEEDGGEVHFDGIDITDHPPHEIAKLGLVRTFQLTTPFEDLSVTENLLAVYSKGLRVTAAKRRRAEEVLEFLEIDHVSDNDASDLSGGQQKLLELGRVLMLEPKCILLDEPTAGVNPALADRILDRIDEMRKDGTSIVIIEHDMNVVRSISDAVTVFDRGKVIAHGSFDDVAGNKQVQEAYLGTEDEAEGSPL